MYLINGKLYKNIIDIAGSYDRDKGCFLPGDFRRDSEGNSVIYTKPDPRNQVAGGYSASGALFVAERLVQAADEEGKPILDKNGNFVFVKIRPLSIFPKRCKMSSCIFQGKSVFDVECEFTDCEFLSSSAYVAKMIPHPDPELSGVQIRVFKTINDTERAVTGKDYVTKDFSNYNF